jgi:hypothetical protein
VSLLDRTTRFHGPAEGPLDDVRTRFGDVSRMDIAMITGFSAAS